MSLSKYILKDQIPDNVAIWFMDFYASQVTSFINVNDIPKILFTISKNVIKKETQTLYRGESRDYKITEPIRFSPDNGAGISWTMDKEIAEGFIEPDFDGYGYLYELNVDDIRYPISMDLIMDNISDRQVQLIKNPMTRNVMLSYSSEREVLVFDTFKSNILKIIDF